MARDGMNRTQTSDARTAWAMRMCVALSNSPAELKREP